jgi:KDO2-lipid IV(A) lauroyltransferase
MKHAPIRHRLEYLPYLAIKRLLLSLSHRRVRSFGHALGNVAHRFDARHRQIALDNLAMTMPDLDQKERERVVQSCYRHFGAAFCEAVSAGRFTAEEVRSCFDIEGMEHVEAAQALDRGLLLICGHFGAWQVAPYALGLIFGGVNVVARPPDNPYVAGDIHQLRERCGVTVLSRKGTGHRLFKIIRKKGVLGMVIDQRVPDNTGIIVPFMGHPARTSSVPAFIALKNRAPVIPTLCYPAEDGRYRLIFREAILGEGEGDEAVAAMTTRMLEGIAADIRMQPELWLWMHRRWRL